MDNEQRESQLLFEEVTGQHNCSPATCMKCGKLITVGMNSKCPHEENNQKYVMF